MPNQLARYPPSSSLRASALTNRVHKRTRDDHASEVAEDYVEAIGDKIAANGVCRSMDLVQEFSVTHATVNNTVARLQRDGLVTTQPYQPIELTAAGKRLATAARKRHEIVKSFLEAMGVSSRTAAIDSEGIEHHVSKETLQAMKKILKNGWPATER
ncbi:manganese-binding transcriptional regulator MntR [Roseimaritima multifibrata]|uniref:manganese-binding transcriptional regulator MntR n=1 Tax=Roseimaritima multifibrata TaxID=1930274 RepID=UPI0028F3FCAC|nr:manganese-binding transcriptional regulator MntR [Roseimaritima multifibrata]